MAGICEGRVAVITGAGRGIGRDYALMFAAQGAKVVVNDLGGQPDGAGFGLTAAEQVVKEIEALGGQAVVNGGDVSDFAAAKDLVDQAVDTFGGLDVLVNNAGILRDRMLTNMTEDEWDSVIRVHLKGTFSPSHHAARYWRDRVKGGTENRARIINTSSASGLYGNPGQSNYGAAKQGIAAFTIITALELGRYGVTVNAIAPAALTRLTENLSGELPADVRDAMSPRWIAPLCTWLASEQSEGVTGNVFEASGNNLGIAEGWHRGPSAPAVEDPAAVDTVMRALLADARPPAGMPEMAPPA